MNGFTTVACLIVAAVLVVIVFLANAIRIVPEYQRLVVFRLGRVLGNQGTRHRAPHPGHRPGRARGLARAGPRGAASDLDHQG